MTKRNFRKKENDRLEGKNKVSNSGKSPDSDGLNTRGLQICGEVRQDVASVLKINGEDEFVAFFVLGRELPEELRKKFNVQDDKVDPILLNEALRLVALARESYCQWLDRFDASNSLKPLNDLQPLNTAQILESVRRQYFAMRSRLLFLFSSSMEDAIKKRLLGQD